MSGSGVFVTVRERSDQPFAIGAQIRLGIVMKHGDPQGGPLIVRCQGTVVRVEPAPQVTGIAVSCAALHFEVPATDGIAR